MGDVAGLVAKAIGTHAEKRGGAEHYQAIAPQLDAFLSGVSRGRDVELASAQQGQQRQTENAQKDDSLPAVAHANREADEVRRSADAYALGVFERLDAEVSRVAATIRRGKTILGERTGSVAAAGRLDNEKMASV